MKKDTLYYDGQCPLCSLEMGHLRKKANESLELVDIHTAKDLPVDKASCLKQLHLKTSNGLVVGIDANVAAWQHTSIGWLWRFLQWPVVKPIATKVYSLWAIKRYEKRYGSESKHHS